MCPEASSARPRQVYRGARKLVQEKEEMIGCLKDVGGTVILLGKPGGDLSAVPAGSLPDGMHVTGTEWLVGMR